MYTSKKVENEGKGKAPFDINIRSVIAMMKIGRGYSSLEKGKHPLTLINDQ